MKFVFNSLVAIVCFLNSSFAQTVSTPIVGFANEQLPAGQHFFSPSFQKASVFSGSATVTGTTVTGLNLAGSLGASTFTDRANFPTHYLEITSGPYAGTYYDIGSNTANSVTLTETPNTSGAVTIAIRPHVTLADVIKSESGIGEFSDSIAVYNRNGGFAIYYFADGEVKGDNFATPMGHVPVHPGKGIGLNAGSNLQVKTSGQVRDKSLQVPVYPGAVNVVGSMNPSSGTKITSLSLGDELSAFSETALLYDATGNLGLIAIVLSDGTSPTDDNFNAYTTSSSPSLSTKSTMLVNVDSVKYISLPSPVQ